ncbi:UNVERIFIED_CONTAM: hypothetical protein K2H54_034951 [Gekko kuhli]
MQQVTNMQKCLVKKVLRHHCFHLEQHQGGTFFSSAFMGPCCLNQPAILSVTYTIPPSAGNHRVRQRRRLLSLGPSRQGELTRRYVLASFLPPWLPFGKLAYPPVSAFRFSPSCHVPQLENPSAKPCVHFWKSSFLVDMILCADQRPSS